jgi:cold shock CspA family protein
VKTVKAIITLFIPDKFYGFGKVPDTEEQFFFHLGDFRWIPGQSSPPPVVGEWVQVEYDDTQPKRGSAPKASRVERLQQPLQVQGDVEQFDVGRGYGFIKGKDGKSYYLHRSDMDDPSIPVKGDRVRYFAGFKRGKPRACYCQIM